MFGKRFGKILKTAILAGLLCFQSVPVSAGALNACGEKVESVLGKAGDAIGNALVLHAEAAEATAEVGGTVRWDRSNENTRPDSVTLHLLRNGTDTGKTTTTTKAGNWKFTFGQQPLNDANGKAYEYSVKEDAVTVSGDTYTTTYDAKYLDEKTAQLKMTFNGSSKTEYASYDYVQIYYKDSKGNTKVTDKLGGNTIANSSVVIPYGDFYVYFESDSSANYYGFKFASINATTGETLTTVSDGSLPSVTAIEKSGTDYPETAHNYGNNQQLLWHYTPDTFIAGWNCAVTNTGHCIANGTWGTCPWGIYTQGHDTILEISAGTGANTDGNSPWKTYASQITKVKAAEKVVLPSDSSKLFAEFKKAASLDLSNFDTSNVTDMSGMFYGCSALTSLDLSQFDTSKVTNMSYMFVSCYHLAALDVSQWKTSNVTKMNGMFSVCSKLTSLNVSNFNTSKVMNMNKMFDSCSGLTSLNLSNFDTSQVTDMSSMFYYCSALTSLDLSKWQTGKVTDMAAMFAGCSKLTSLDVSKFNTSQVTKMRYMVDGCSSLTSLDLSKFDTSKVTDMSGMFSGCSMLTSLDLSKFNTSKVTDMSHMFEGCSALPSLDVSKFDTSKVTDMSGMFFRCSALTSLDLRNFNTSKVTDMGFMFIACSALTSLDLSKFDTSNVTKMSAMFEGCSALPSLDVSKFDTSKVTDMYRMFRDCSGLTSIDLSNFNTSKVMNMGELFSGCSSLTSLDVSKFDTSKKPDMGFMFYGCSALNSISFGPIWKQTLEDAYLPNSDWVQTRDKYGTKQLSSAQYALGTSNVTYVDSDNAVRVAKDTAHRDDANDLYLIGTWTRVDALYYDKDADGDETYTSQDIVSGQKDSAKPYYDADDDTYNEWVQDGNVWKYTFKVFDDSKKYFVSESNVDGYSKLFSSTKKSNYGRINDGTTPRSESITNTKHDFGSLQIKKTVAGTNLPSDAQTHLFTFKVTLKDRDGNQLTGPLPCGNVVFNDGTATVTASTSKPVTITNIPIGYAYTVTEEDTKDYTESAPVSGTIAKDTTATAAFTNTYVEKPRPKTADVTLTKKITGRYGDTLPDDSYPFSIEFMGLETNESYSIVDNAGKTAATFTANDSGHAAATLSLKPNETVTIKALPVGSTYMITEEAGDYTASYTVSNASSTGTIASLAGSNTTEDTALSTAEETVDDGEQTAVTFTNDVEKTQTVTLKKFVGKGKSSNDAAADGGFDFTENTASTEKYNFTVKFYDLAESDSFSSSIGKIYAMDPADPDDIKAGAAANTWTASKDFQMGEGDVVTFRGVPVGTKYVITEAETPCDVKVSVTGTNVATQTTVTPSSDTSHATSMETVDYGEDSVVTFKNRVNDTAALQIVKEAFSGDRLPGAEFTIYNADQSDTIKDAKGNALKLTTTSSGYSNVVTGLSVGTYYIVETKAPSGYSVIEPMKLEITNDDLGKTKKIVIRDSSLIVLPNTGGEGLWKYALIVTGLAAGFTAVTIASRKKKKKAA